MKTFFALFFAAASASAFAAPGAHGPGGEHLDAPSQGGSARSAPRVEAASELFELVARLQKDELSILIDRFESNEPVLGAEVEVQFGGLRAKAKFHSDHGDYAIDDAALLKALAAPGEHALVFTIVAGKDTDLLDGKLVIDAADANAHGRDHGHWLERMLIATGVIALAGLLFFGWKRRRATAGAAALFALCVLAALGVDAAPGAHGPGGEHLDGAAGKPAGLARLADGSVNLPKSAQRRLEIRTVLAPLTEAAATVEIPGRVITDPNAGGRVQAVRGGRVEPGSAGLPVVGQKVARGQVLAYVRYYAEPYAQANQQAQLTELNAGRTLAEQKLKRLESLEGTVPRKEIEAARVELQSFIERGRTVGTSIGTRETLLAPVSGVVSAANALAGQVVEARDILFEVVDPARTLVEGVLADIALAEQIAGAHLQGHPAARLRVLGIGRSLREGVVPVTFRAESGGDTKPLALAIGQPVTVIAVLRERIRGIVLPAQSVVRNPANEPIVWIKAGAERYVPQPVRYQPLNAQTVVITGGLAPDNRVVVQGAGLISQIR